MHIYMQTIYDAVGERAPVQEKGESKGDERGQGPASPMYNAGQGQGQSQGQGQGSPMYNARNGNSGGGDLDEEVEDDIAEELEEELEDGSPQHNRHGGGRNNHK